MALPDTGRLRALPPEQWRALGRRLQAIGYTDGTSEAVRELATRGANPTRVPMAKWHARRVSQPWGPALRMLRLSDPVTEAEARGALGEGLPLERVLEAGLVERTAGGAFVSPYLTDVAMGNVVLCENLSSGAEAVMGAGHTTVQLVRASSPRTRVGSALDLGCGAGTAALALAPHCDRVVATDISPRAVDVARVNVWMNGLGNVEVRQGDLYAPLAGEAFDLVVAQPPFVARPDDSEATTFLSGGSRGDELPLRVLRELRPHLAPGGTAVIVVEWPVIEGDPPLLQRLAEALGGGDASLLLVQAPPADVLDEHCVTYAMVTEPALDEAWERQALRRRDHFERIGLRELTAAFAVVRRAAAGAPGWTAAVESRRFAVARVTRERIEAMVAARDVDALGREGLRAAQLRVSNDVTFAQRATRYVASFGEDGIGENLVLDENTMTLLKAVHDAPTVGEALDGLAASFGQPALADEALGVVQGALLRGLLEPG